MHGIIAGLRDAQLACEERLFADIPLLEKMLEGPRRFAPRGDIALKFDPLRRLHQLSMSDRAGRHNIREKGQGRENGLPARQATDLGAGRWSEGRMVGCSDARMVGRRM